MDLNSLQGEELYAVEFVEKHLQLRFADDALLTLYIWPEVADADGISVGHGQAGYRDALCSLIGETVSEAQFHDDTALTVEFENGTLLALSLRDEDRDDATDAGSFRNIHGEVFDF
ncbi:hypothetical protein [Terriglobus sp. RCC_193]|uniref:hypothetical protein n=1 Tax=Terriglobus sp. RCC_193 TaxID=3239218 RepID=UPI00352328DA